MAKRTVLLDGDTVLFAATSAAQFESNFDHKDVVYLWTNIEDAKERFASSVERIQNDLGADHTVVALSCDNEQRYRPLVMPEYKANRSGSRKPVGYYVLRAWVEEEYDTYIRPTLEGDDVLGILATHPNLVKGEKIVAAIDKDLKTIPSTLYNYDRKTLEEIDERAADLFFIKQCLMGDATDGYSGCPGIGPKTADKVIDKALSEIDAQPIEPMEPLANLLWPYVVETYVSKGLSEEVALQNARVARILRATDYDFKNKKVILWTPSTAA